MDRATPLSKLFDFGTTRMLEAGGYETVGEILQAADSTLLLVRGMNSAILRVVRERIAAKMGGEDNSVFPVKSKIEEPLMVRDVSPVRIPMNGKPSLEEALEMVASAGQGAIEEIDRKIEGLRSQIVKYRRMRKLLGAEPEKREGRSKSKRPSGKSPAEVGICHAVRAILQESGAMRVKDLAAALMEQGTEIHYLALSKLLAGYPGLRKTEEGLIEVV